MVHPSGREAAAGKLTCRLTQKEGRMEMKNRMLTATLLALSIFASSGTAQAQAKKACVEGPMTIIVPRSAGGGNDLLARLVGAEWAKTLGIDVVIQNVEGAGGAIGLAQAYRAPADGRTVVTWSPPGEYILEMQGRLRFKASDWEMIGATNSDPGFIAVPANSPFKSVKDLIAASKNGSKRLSVGSTGRTSISALEAMLYEELFGVKWGLVPFDGGGDMNTALLGGHIDFAVREGGFYANHPEQLRILSVASSARISELPDVPTVEEAFGEKVIYAAYRGLVVKKGTPEPILKCLRETFNQAAKSPAVVEGQFKSIGFRYEFLDAQQFAEANERQEKVAEKYRARILGK
jgi:tripartite-type tricarboxylate transporter receptor subunit TctC